MPVATSLSNRQHVAGIGQLVAPFKSDSRLVAPVKSGSSVYILRRYNGEEGNNAGVPEHVSRNSGSFSTPPFVRAPPRIEHVAKERGKAVGTLCP